MTTSKPDLKSAKDFDVDLFMSGFTAYQPPVTLHKRGDLKERIDELAQKIEAAERSGVVEESLADEGSVDDLIGEHDGLVKEYDEDVATFRFRAAVFEDWQSARAAALTADPALEENANGLVEAMFPHMWALTCVEPQGLTVDVFQQIRRVLGDAAMAELQSGWERVSRGGVGDEPSAPFSRKPWPTPTKARPAQD